jgi:guanylate kinase
MLNKGMLYIIAAPSGAGKTSLVRAMVDQVDNIVISISHTTRPARPGEVNGDNYHFVSNEAFQELIQKKIFLEHAQVFGFQYGTSADWVSAQIQLGKDVVLEIDWQGAKQIRQLFPYTTGIFIVPPSLNVLQRRLQERAQDSDQVIAKRMLAAKEEISHYQDFDYLIINDIFELAVNDLKNIVLANRLRRERQEKVNQKLLESLLAV